MTSQIGWIDLSPKDRNRVKRFMDLVGMGGVVDELGIGMIRDAMSNKLFPGFSTLYTRAKYFFITPYILLDRDTKQGKKMSGREYFNKAEVAVNRIVIQFYDSHPERAAESYFGKDKKDGQLKRQPSEIYWNGMLCLHLIETDDSLDQLLTNKRSAMSELLASNINGDDTTKEQGENRGIGCENVSFDAKWQNFIAENGLTLTRIEAETLRDRLLRYMPDSIPSALLTSKELWQLYQEARNKANGVDNLDNAFVHFAKNAINIVTNKQLHDNLILAHDMALFLHGAHIAYNIQLRRHCNTTTNYLNELHEISREWFDTLHYRMLDYEHFNIETCMDGTNIKPPTQHFLTEMQRIVRTSTDWNAAEHNLCSLVEKQERWNKKAKSRFVRINNGETLDDMDKAQWIGLSLINYRYSSTLSIVRDIYQGLEIHLSNGNTQPQQSS